MLHPQIIIAAWMLGAVALLIILSKVITKLWLYYLMLAPSLASIIGTIYDASTQMMEAYAQNASLTEITYNVTQTLAFNTMFLFKPIDQYLVGAGNELTFLGLGLLTLWAVVLALLAKDHLPPEATIVFVPTILWFMGKTLPNTRKLITQTIPPLAPLINLYYGFIAFVILPTTTLILIKTIKWYKNREAI